MTILVREGMKVIVQGITGTQGREHSRLMLEYGTNIVAGVTPGKGGEEVHGVPVFDNILDVVNEFGEIDASVLFVPAPFAFDAIVEAVNYKIPLLVVITEGLPVHDAMKAVSYARMRGSTIVGPNTPGVISPKEKVKLGIMPADAFSEGNIALVSRSGTLTYEISMALKKEGLGTSITIGVGGDPITGLDFVDVLKMLRDDNETKGVVLVGEIGGDAEERVARYISETTYPKPVVAFVAGRTAPPGKRMGHAGAIISGNVGRIETKEKAFKDSGVPVAKVPWEVPSLIKKSLRL
ncbi:MAG TPA: succinate--CoA ligase subunit alpha [Candidatus Korarchaeota archaeon]|nr:succinate--CoA ligase subunit alpha [Candidatus Korarchaeota archaeon]